MSDTTPVDALLDTSGLAGQHDLPRLIAETATRLGAADATVYLADLQQVNLIPFVDETASAVEVMAEPLAVDATVAGRAFQHIEVFTRASDGASTEVFVPLVEGAHRVGVLALRFTDDRLPDVNDGEVERQLRRYAALVAHLLVTKTAYGDTMVRLCRSAEMGLAAELQWSLLPPLTFACREVTVAGALEPAYHIAGDSLDYAVDAARARAAVLDGMGHGLSSSQLAAIAVAAHRNARRSGLGLPDTAAAIHEAIRDAYRGQAFTTGVLAELDTQTGMLTWINAGHPAPLLLRGTKLVKTLTCAPGLPFGLTITGRTQELRFIPCYEQLEPDDRVLLYTDGVTEARSPDGQFFGEPRLTDLITRSLADGLPAPETMRRIVRALLTHQQGQLTDDATMLLIHWHP